MTRHDSNSYHTTEDRTIIADISPETLDSIGITRSDPGSSLGRAVLAGHNTITEVWQELVEDPEVLEYLIVAARKAMIGLDRDEAEKLLESLDITDTPLMGHDPSYMILDLRRKPAIAKKSSWIICEIAQELGTGSSSIEDIISIGRLFQFAHHQNPHLSIDTEVLAITVEIDYKKFTKRSQSQRINLCRLLSVLSKAFDIRLAASQKTQAFLKQFHSEDLPCVSEWSITQGEFTDTDEALVKLASHGTSAKILDALDQVPNGTLSYAELYSFVEKSDSRVRQCIGDLREYGLILPFGPQDNKKVTLLKTGAEVLDNLRQQSEQRSLPQESPDTPPNFERHRREYDDAVRWSGEDTATEINREEGRRPEAADRPAPQYEVYQESNSDYSTGRMRPSMRDAVVACGIEPSTITIVDDSIDHLDSTAQFFAVDGVNSEVVVSSHATNPLDYTVGIAMALAHPKLISEALSETTLTSILDNTPVEVLSWVRQIAYVSFSEIEADSLQDALLGWRSGIKDLVRRLKVNDYGASEFDSRDDLFSEILRQAHGLAGCIVHLLDEAGIHVVRDIRIPSGVKSSKLEGVAGSIAHSITVQSQYNGFSAHRQLFESREGYRANSFTAKVDAADPFGSLIGSIVVRGGSATRVESDLETELEAFETVEDAPEFAIPITIRKVTRDDVASAADRVLDRKNINLIQTAVPILDRLVDSPFGITRVLRCLDNPSDRRDIELNELRYALQLLSGDDLLSDQPRSVGRVIKALLNASGPVTQTELADRANVTTQTIRNHESIIKSTGFVQCEKTESGKKNWSIALSTDSEQDEAPRSCSQQSGERTKYEVLVGDDPMQVSILDTKEFNSNMAVENDPEKVEIRNSSQDNHSDSDDEEIDVDFSDVSIPGSSEVHSDSTTC